MTYEEFLGPYVHTSGVNHYVARLQWCTVCDEPAKDFEVVKDKFMIGSYHIRNDPKCPRCAEVLGLNFACPDKCECGGLVHYETRTDDHEELIFYCDICGENYNKEYGN